jgi:two-component system, NtrC family, response regulator AtoC
MKIMVVDDEPAIVQMCLRVLEAQGHAVRGFTRAEEALSALAAQPADLLVVDYKMPELTGLDFIQRAWTLHPELRVVMITAHGTREVIGKATSSGVKNIVLKPFTPAELTKGIADAVGGAEVKTPPKPSSS